MGGVGPLVVVESDPAPDTGLGLRAGFPGVQIDAFVFQGSPKALDEDVVQRPGFAVHGYLGLGPLQSVGPVEGCELRPLIRVHDLGRAELVDGLVQRRNAELGLQRVRYPPGQNLAGKPLHALRRLKAIACRPKDGHQIEEPFAHPWPGRRFAKQICQEGQIGDVGAPDLIGPINPQPALQRGVGLVPLRGLAPSHTGFACVVGPRVLGF